MVVEAKMVRLRLQTKGLKNLKGINLTQEKIAVVDDDDLERVSCHKWFACRNRNTYYAQAVIGGKQISMHRLIMNAPAGKEIDHINGDGLDNRKRNLRLASRGENACNRGVQKNNKLRTKGVQQQRGRKNFIARIDVDGKTIYLGTFPTVEEASQAYKTAAEKYFGQFAQAEADSKRLDWLEANRPKVYPTGLGGFGWGISGSGDGFSSLRAAIDAAKAGEDAAREK